MGDQPFQEGDLVWARTKGFPMWPAKIVEAQGNGKYCVVFFGSRETSFLKQIDLKDYIQYRQNFETNASTKPEFRLALEEIRREAGLPPLGNDVEDYKPTDEDLVAPIDMNLSSSSFGRVRRPSARFADGNFVAPIGMARRRNNSNSISYDFGFERSRTDSNSSFLGGFRRNKGPSITEFGELDLVTAGNVLQGDLGLSGMDSDFSNNQNRYQRRRRRTTSRLLEELVSTSRDRNTSISSDLKPNMDPNSLFDMLDTVGNNMDLHAFYHAIDMLPSEESDRPQTPENVLPMPNQPQYCPRCHMAQKYTGFEWRCPNNCDEFMVSQEKKMDIHNMEDLEQYFDNSPINDRSPFSYKSEVRKSSNGQTNNGSSSVKKSTRRSYKVEKTPAVQADGVRYCIFCNGHVRPQMCGGNKHRWRCVDKKCRKWYGWVRSNEKIPNDLGRKGRWKDLKLKVQGHTEDGQLVQMIPERSESPVDEKKILKKKRRNTPPRPLTPMTDEQVNYVPSQLESRARWWRPDRRRQEPSPEKELPEPGVVDSAAILRLCEQSAKSLENLTQALDSPIDSGSATGFADLMLDTVFSAVGPLFSVAVNTLPYVSEAQPGLNRQLFENALDHFPLPNL